MRRWLIHVVVCGWLVGRALAQCEPAWSGTGLRRGFDGRVTAAAIWNPAGSEPLLAVAGLFTMAGNEPAPNVAAWDGIGWTGIGDGLSGSVNAVADAGGTLVIGGNFVTTGAAQVHNLAQLAGGRWSPMGADPPSPVQSLLLWRGALARLTLPTFHTARVELWTGSTWTQLGLDLTGQGYTLGTYLGDLVLGGSFDQPAAAVLRWDGASWSALNGTGAVPAEDVVTMVEFGGSLIAGTSPYFSPTLIWRFDGSMWTPMMAGLREGGIGQFATMRSLAVWNNRLVASGDLQTISPPAAGIAAWDGSTWVQLSTEEPEAWQVWSLLPFRGALAAAGRFNSAGDAAAEGVALVDGATWRGPVGAPAAASTTYQLEAIGATCLGPYQGGMVIGGDFKLQTDAGVSWRLALWDGSAWRGLGSGLPGDWGSGLVAAIAEHNGSLFVGGDLESFPPYIASLARWDGSSWTNVAPGSEGVRALCEFNGELIGGGGIGPLSNNTYATVARWTESGWTAITGAPDGAVTAMMLSDSELLVGGAFATAGGQPCPGVAGWNGSVWHGFGQGVSFNVRTVAFYNGSPIAGGDVPDRTGRLARWDGTTWIPLGETINGAVTALRAQGGDLYAGGTFTSIAGVSANGIARWDGATWRPLGSGVINGGPYFGSSVAALGVFGSDLVAAGGFEWAAGRAAPIVAAWGPIGVGCYANCDCSSEPPVLNVSDFTCFLARFLAGDQYANCDGSSTPPVLNINDFVCFLRRFAEGCP